MARYKLWFMTLPRTNDDAVYKGNGCTASKKEEKEIALYIHIVKGLMAGFGG